MHARQTNKRGRKMTDLYLFLSHEGFANVEKDQCSKNWCFTNNTSYLVTYVLRSMQHPYLLRKRTYGKNIAITNLNTE